MKIFLNNKNLVSIAVFVCFLIFLFIPYLVFAQSELNPTPLPINKIPRQIGGDANQAVMDEVRRVAEPTYGAADKNSVSKIISLVINGFLALVGIIFLILMIYGGYLWMMAKGNDEQVKKAQGLIQTAIIGLIIVIGAYAITNFVLDALLNGRGNGGGNVTPS